MINEYRIKVVREEGEDPLTGEFYPKEFEEFKIEATSRKSAYELAQMLFTLKVRGQLLKIFIDNEQYFAEEN